MAFQNVINVLIWNSGLLDFFHRKTLLCLAKVHKILCNLPLVFDVYSVFVCNNFFKKHNHINNVLPETRKEKYLKYRTKSPWWNTPFIKFEFGLIVKKTTAFSKPLDYCWIRIHTTYFNYRPRNMHNCFFNFEKDDFSSEFNLRIGFYETKNLSDCGMY